MLVAVALIATVAFEAAREHGFPEARFSLRWLRRSWRAVVRVPLDTGLLCREALAQLTQPKRTRGQFRAVPFKAGTSERDRGRYALTEIVGSLAPNTIVIGVDADSDLLLVHQLRRNGDAPRHRRAGAGMNEWELAAIVLMAAIVPCVAVCAFATAAARARGTGGCEHARDHHD